MQANHTTRETLDFTVDNAIVGHLITAQSGSVEKAISELVQNAIDAGATRCEISLDTRNFLVKDDGRGFRTRDEIMENFRCFGKPHAGGDAAVHGVFRVGRGQVMALARTVYTSNTFRMEIDVRKNGYRFDLTVLPSMGTPGCEVRGEFYNPPHDYRMGQVSMNLRRLLAYAIIPVTLNGHIINTPPSAVSDPWDIDDEHCYVRYTQSGGVDIYSLGIYVQSRHEHHHGCNALVISKRPLPLNMARNDVVSADTSAVMLHIDELLNRRGEALRRNARRLNEGQRLHIIRRYLANQIDFFEFAEYPLFLDARGRPLRLGDIANQQRPVCTTPRQGSEVASHVQDEGLALVLSGRLYDDFETDAFEQLLQGFIDRAMEKLLQDCCAARVVLTYTTSGYSLRAMDPEDTTRQAAIRSLTNRTNLLEGMECIEIGDFHELAKQLDRVRRPLVWRDRTSQSLSRPSGTARILPAASPSAGRGRPAVRQTAPAHNGSTPREARLPRTTRPRFALPGAQRTSFSHIPDEDLTPRHQAALKAVRAGASRMASLMSRAGMRTPPRKVFAGRQDGTEAWTDGRRVIHVTRKLLSKVEKGLVGPHGVASVLLHEYVHDSSDQESHGHDFEFFNAYHDLACRVDTSLIHKTALRMREVYLRDMKARRLPLPNSALEYATERVFPSLCHGTLRTNPGTDGAAQPCHRARVLFSALAERSIGGNYIGKPWIFHVEKDYEIHELTQSLKQCLAKETAGGFAWPAMEKFLHGHKHLYISITELLSFLATDAADEINHIVCYFSGKAVVYHQSMTATVAAGTAMTMPEVITEAVMAKGVLGDALAHCGKANREAFVRRYLSGEGRACLEKTPPDTLRYATKS